MATTRGSLKMTAFIVSLAIAFPVLPLILGISRIRKRKTAIFESDETRHIRVAVHC